MKNEKKSCVVAGRILQNVFLSDARTAEDLNTMNENSKYYELRRTVVSDGIKEELIEVDYPITSDYVNSFSDSADYKKDIPGAIAGSDTSRKNLGDVVDMQRVLSMDSESAKKLAQNLRNVAVALEQKQKTGQKTENTEKEVKSE